MQGALNKCKSFTRIVRYLLIATLIYGGTGIVSDGFSQEKARISGTIVDHVSGEVVIGANVYLEGTTLGAATDLEGAYLILNVDPGTYTLIVSMMGYTPTKVTNVIVHSGDVLKYDVSLQTEVVQGEEVVIEAKLIENTDIGLLKDRQRAVEVSDAVSAEFFSRAGSGDAAEAIGKVTGVSIADGKYIYVRGLGDRYGNTQLNGASLPSADPDKKTVPLDLFPTALLDKITTVKSFTPDKPGNFAGGSVDIGTKSLPEHLSFNFSTQSSYNTKSSFNDGFLTQPVSGTDWFGYDDGLRALPAEIKDPNTVFPGIATAWQNDQSAAQLQNLTRAFNNAVMAPVRRSVPMNQSIGFAGGNRVLLFGRPLGILGSYSYKRDYKFYDDGRTERWILAGGTTSSESLHNYYRLEDNRGLDEVLWGGLGTLHYQVHPKHELGMTYIFNRSSESEARYAVGEDSRGDDDYYETRVLRFTQRQLQSLQLRGDHAVGRTGALKIDWQTSYSDTRQDEPDSRYFSNGFNIRDRQGAIDTVYAIRAANYSLPARFFRDLQEDNANFLLNLAAPFAKIHGKDARIKVGGYHETINRTYGQQRFEYWQDVSRYDGNPEQYFSTTNLGIVDDSGSLNRFGLYLKNATQLRESYTGEQQNSATYAMLDLPILSNLRFVGGVRWELTDMQAVGGDTTQTDALRIGKINQKDLLPSTNFIYSFGDNTNLRFSYGRTLARPTLREMAAYPSFDFVGDFIFIGNVNIKRTLIDNYDARWEWFSRPGEIVAVSGFYKRFYDPIERVNKDDNNEVQPQNVDLAVVYGVELELRKRLDEIHPFLENWYFGSNLSLIRSRVDIAEEEMLFIRASDPEAQSYRNLQGQSPYVINMDVSYRNQITGTSAGLFFNVFGRRIASVSRYATPDIEENPRPLLDFTCSQQVWKFLTLKFSAKNLLNSSFEQVYRFKGEEYTYQTYDFGRTFSIGASYGIQ